MKTKVSSKTESNAVLTALLNAACERFDTTPKGVKDFYPPRRPAAEKVIMARGFFIALARSMDIPLSKAAKHIDLTSPGAYNAQVQYQSKHGLVSGKDALNILSDSK